MSMDMMDKPRIVETKVIHTSPLFQEHEVDHTKSPSLTETEWDGSTEEGFSEICGQSETQSISTDKSERSVQFSFINVRLYSRILGDNPSCSSGPSISIGWDFEAERKTSIDDYEMTKESVPRRSRKDHHMLVPRLEREVMLLGLGYSRRAIAEAVRQNVKCKNQRRRTVHNLFLSGVEEATERTMKIFKTCINFGQRKKNRALYYPPRPQH